MEKVTVRNFVFGLRTPHGENAENITQEFWHAHRFYNQLIEISRSYWKGVEKLRRRMFPEYCVLAEKSEELETQLIAHRKSLKKEKSEKRTRVVNPTIAKWVKQVETEKKAVDKLLQTERKKHTPGWGAKRALLRLVANPRKKRNKDTGVLEEPGYTREMALTELNAVEEIWLQFGMGVCALERVTHDMALEAYAASPCYGGTKAQIIAQVDQAMKDSMKKGKLARFQAWDGTGRLSVQLLPIIPHKKLLEPTCKAHVSNFPEFPEDAKSGLKSRISRDANTQLAFYVGKDKPRLCWRVNLHRALPKDATIAFAHIVRQRHGLFGFKDSLMLVVKTWEAAPVSDLQQGTTAINFGWRKFKDGLDTNLRVALVQNDGFGVVDVRLSAEIYRRFQKCKDLQSIVDKWNDAKWPAIVAAFQSIRSDFGTNSPLWEATQNIEKWESPYRFAELYRKQALQIRGIAYELLHEWYHRWVHLFGWCRNQHEHTIRRRNYEYRQVAFNIAKSSKRILLEDFDIRDVAEIPPAEQKTEGGREAREHRTWASVSTLREFIADAARKYGCQIEILSGENKTKRCYICGELTRDDPAAKVTCVCPKNHSWDQDVNNTDNQLFQGLTEEIDAVA